MRCSTFISFASTPRLGGLGLTTHSLAQFLLVAHGMDDEIFQQCAIGVYAVANAARVARANVQGYPTSARQLLRWFSKRAMAVSSY